ncbi:MAG: type II toxin-antitoxin system VapC family toxin, partial [Thermoprotei archaeon]
WGLADSIVLATARKSKAKVITGDEHFRDLAGEVILIK